MGSNGFPKVSLGGPWDFPEELPGFSPGNPQEFPINSVSLGGARVSLGSPGFLQGFPWETLRIPWLSLGDPPGLPQGLLRDYLAFSGDFLGISKGLPGFPLWFS